MSATAGQKPPEVDVDTLVLNIQVLREEIDALREFLRKLLESRENIDRAIAGLRGISAAEGSTLVFLDSSYSVAVAVAPVEKGKALISLGFNVYAKLPVEEAVKILEERKAKVEKAIGEASRTLTQLAALHDRYYALLQQALASQASRR